jgi:PAS domain S-box-containing protein
MMKDEDKTKEQLLDELLKIRKRLQEVEASCAIDRQDADTLRSFKKALETMQIGVTITDLKGTVVYSNPADLEMHGYSSEELKDANVTVFAPPERRKPLTEEEIISMKRWKRESVNKRKDGKTFPVHLMSDVIKDSEGKPVGIVTTCEDITDRKKMEEEIKGRIEELEQFYDASVSREVKMKDLKKEIQKLKEELAQYKEKEISKR